MFSQLRFFRIIQIISILLDWPIAFIIPVSCGIQKGRHCLFIRPNLRLLTGIPNLTQRFPSISSAIQYEFRVPIRVPLSSEIQASRSMSTRSGVEHQKVEFIEESKFISKGSYVHGDCFSISLFAPSAPSFSCPPLKPLKCNTSLIFCELRYHVLCHDVGLRPFIVWCVE